MGDSAPRKAATNSWIFFKQLLLDGGLLEARNSRKALNEPTQLCSGWS